MIKKKYLTSIVILLIFAVFAVISLLNQSQIKQEINQNNYETTAKIYKVFSNRSFSHVYYKYYFENQLFETYEDVDEYVGDLKNRFFEVHISTKNPEYSRIQLDREVTDTVRIRAAGFNIER